MSAGRDTLRDRVAIITGGGSGIGAATAARLVARGAHVTVSDLAVSQAPVVDGVTAVTADVRRYEDMTALRDAVLERHGRIDLVVANAGIADWGSIAEGDPDRWRDVLETNVLGVALTLRAFVPTLVEQGAGHVVITASISGRVTYLGEPIYIASKWALVGLGRTLRKELAPSGIRVTLVEPGIVDTPLVSATEEGRRELAQVKALHPDDVADAIAYAVERPPHVDVDELMLSPLGQTM
jgi:3-hydroxy acid dehydrogenase / malonic semialdehyde reductase